MEQIRVPSSTRTAVVTVPLEEDDPIESWDKDFLNRSWLVDTICVKVLISKSPVVAIFGDFGAGKTSILNLLRSHLSDKAMVVIFNTWLPGSRDALVSSLLRDIAAEVRKFYVFPDLRKGLLRLTNAIAQSVPLLKGLPMVFSPYTQRDDFDDLRKSLARLPKRVVVLLDDLDRMRRKELLALLKVIRGVSSLPNVSFVCALEREKVEEIGLGEFSPDSHVFFEKFFPVSIELPKIDEDVLKNAGIERVVTAFKRHGWFEDDPESEKALRQDLDRIWNEEIGAYCTNLRQIGLLANDVSVASAPLVNEVNPLDLILIELLRRFEPALYSIIWENRAALTYPVSLTKLSRYVSDEEQKASEATTERKVEHAKLSRRDRAESVLKQLFPRYKAKRLESGGMREDARKTKRVAHPDYFPAYFRYELPQDVFGTKEMAGFVARVRAAASPARREGVFREMLSSLSKGSSKRSDFLRQLSDATKSMDISVARDVATAAVRAANEITYDMFHGFAEAGDVLRLVMAVAERTPKSQTADLLAQCVRSSTDDTMALRILTDLTDKARSGVDLGVSLDELNPSFIERMRRRYADSTIDVSELDLTTSDPRAFAYWGSLGAEEQSAQADFWRRYIGQSRARLAHAFRFFLMPEGIYPSDPQPYVERMLPIADLRDMLSELPNDGGLSESELKSLRRLKRLLDGAFKDGIPIDALGDDIEDSGLAPSQVPTG